MKNTRVDFISEKGGTEYDGSRHSFGGGQRKGDLTKVVVFSSYKY